MSQLTTSTLDKLRDIGRTLLKMTREYLEQNPDCTDADVDTLVRLACQTAVKEFSREELEEIAAVHIAKAFHASAEQASKFINTLRGIQESLNKRDTQQPTKDKS